MLNIITVSKTKIILSIIFLLGIFNLSLTAQWVNDPSINKGVVVAPGNQSKPKIISSSSYPGISYVSWVSNKNGSYNVRLQKLDASGNELWDSGGLLVSNSKATSWLTDWDMIIDANDCAIIVCQDERTGSKNIFAYKISPDGTFMWGNSGIQLSNTTALDAAPKVAVTSTGNTVVAWESDGVIIRQKITPGGILKWGDNGITLTGANTLSCPQLLPAGNDDVIMKYMESAEKDNNTTSNNIYAQRFYANGDKIWLQAAIISDACGVSANTQIVPFINDGNDGFYIAWHDDRNNSLLTSVFVQHISSGGKMLFKSNGVRATNNSNRNQNNSHLIKVPGSNDIFIFWDEMDATNTKSGICGQKISSKGVIRWSSNGKAFIENHNKTVSTITTTASETDMLIIYEESPDIEITDIKAMRIDANGSYVWPSRKITISDANSKKLHVVTSSYNFGQWIVVWEDDRSISTDIYGQNILLDGSCGSIPPLFNASFIVDENSISVDETVQFTENSLGNITSWKWKFEGGTPATSLDQNQGVTYSTSGSYDVELIISDGVVTDTTFRSNYIFVYDDPDKLNTHTESVNTHQDVTIGKSAIVIQSTDKFFIVVSSFLEESKAKQQVEELKYKGMDALVVYTEESGRYRVALMPFDNRADALKMLQSIRKHNYPDAWLLVK